MTRVFNFSAGPAVLPEPVIAQVSADLPSWRESGMAVMEMSHRGPQFMKIAEKAEHDLRALLEIPANYRVLFLQGGATMQFSSVPLNLCRTDTTADYVITGSWGKKAHKEGARLCKAHVAADAADCGYTGIPPEAEWQRSEDAAFLHYTPNETIGGVEFHTIPATGAVPLVADMSSTILSRPVEVSRFGLIYAGAQKNVGPAGLTIVIVRDDLIGQARPGTPALLDYKLMADTGSMSNTPPTFAWYVAGLVFEWIGEQGGLAAMGRRNQDKAQLLYSAIDAGDFYSNPVDLACRSWMNVPFTLADPQLDAKFLADAAAEGFVGLKGHRSVGGMRASIYNAMPREGVQALVAFMNDFQQRHG